LKRLVALAVTALLLAGCDVFITAPQEGTIVSPGNVTVTGVIDQYAAVGGTIVVNGVPGTLDADRTWTAEVPVAGAPGDVVPVEVVYTEPGPGGKVYTDETAFVTGPSIAAGAFSPNGVGMRFTNTGLTGLGPVINDLAGGSFDISTLLLAQQPLIHQEDAFIGHDITANAYEAGISSVNLTAQSTTGGVRTNIAIAGLYIGLDLHISGLINADCRLELEIPTTTIVANFDLAPQAGSPGNVDVNLVGAPTVNTGTVNHRFISGICDGDTFLIGDIVDSIAGGQIQGMIGSGFSTQLGDPDGAGPADSPVADAIEEALAEISIAGTVGAAVGANLDAPFTAITETADAIDFRADADFFSSVGTGPNDCQPPAGAPTFPNTFDVPAPYPTLGATTPGGAPYGLGLVISASAFNQMIATMTECGLLSQDITTIDLFGTQVPITSSVLAAIAPGFASVGANVPMLVRLRPTVGPFLTTDAGPNGEPSELMIANLILEFVQPGTAFGDVVHLSIAVDSPMGFDLAYDAVNNQLAPTIAAPPAAEVDARVRINRIGADELALETLFPTLFPTFASGLGDTFAAFPLPAFLGLDLDVVEVAQTNGYYVMYGNLDPAPATHIENFAVTNLSTADSAVDSVAFDSNEWRSRLRTSHSSNGARVDLDALVGADSCCFADGESRSGTASYRMAFDVVPAEGDTWQVALNHSIAGAHSYLNEALGGASSSITTVTGRARIGAGAWQNFNFNPSIPSSGIPNNGSSGNNQGTTVGFTGQNSLNLQGTTAVTITVEFSFSATATSINQAFAFPPRSGDEAAVRIGANDTLTNDFIAGDYPGFGNRNIVTDGHVATVTLTTVG
jgi:hypothetical protein